jgi:hypothetical protein
VANERRHSPLGFRVKRWLLGAAERSYSAFFREFQRKAFPQLVQYLASSFMILPQFRHALVMGDDVEIDGGFHMAPRIPPISPSNKPITKPPREAVM